MIDISSSCPRQIMCDSKGIINKDRKDLDGWTESPRVLVGGNTTDPLAGLARNSNQSGSRHKQK